MNHYMSQRPLPKSMPKWEREYLVEELKEIRRVATWGESWIFDYMPGDPGAVTVAIRRVTKRWRESILAPLDALIYRYETGEAINNKPK